MDQRPNSDRKRMITLWKNRYYDDVIFEYLGNQGLIESLMRKYDLKELPIDQIDKRIRETLLENSSYLDDSFRVFLLEKNEKSASYYDEEESEEDIRIIIGNNQYLYCDSPRLYLDMFIQRGIKKEDYDADDMICLEYLSKLDQRNELDKE